MRFERLILERYGQFERLDLDLTGDLVIVYGPNEAGKTTLLSAINALMFGIHQRTPYNFMYDYQAMSIRAEMLDAAGRRLQLCRRKRKKQALSGLYQGDGTSGVLDEAGFAAYFGGLSASLYQSVFGFTQHHLQQGSEVLRISGLHEILGGGALGGAGRKVHAILEKLGEEADARFLPRGKNPPINRLTAALTGLRTQLRQATFDRTQYQNLTGELQQIEAQLTADATAIDELQVRHTTHQKALEYYEDVDACDRLQVQLKAFDEPAVFDRATAQDVLGQLEEGERCQRKLDGLRTQLQHLRRRADALAYDPTLLQVQQTVQRLATQAISLASMHQQLPGQERTLADERQRIADALKQLSPEPQRKGKAKAKRRDAVTFLGERAGKLRQLSAASQELEQLAQSLADTEREHERQAQVLACLRQTVEDVTSRDHPELARLHRQLSAMVDTSRRMEELERELSQIQREQEQDLLCISKYFPEGIPDPLPSLDSYPNEPEIAGFASQLQQLAREQRGLTLRLDEASEAHAVARAQLKALEQAETLPDPRDLTRVRIRRDRTWEVVRRIWERGEPPDLETQAYAPGGDLAAAFEAAMHEADATADRMRDAAGEVARRVELLAQVARHQTERKLRRARLKKVAHEREQLWTAWCQRWAACGIEPESPEQMLEVRRRLLAWQQRRRRSDEARAEHQRLLPAKRAYEDALRQLLELPDATWETLVDRLVDQGREADRRVGQLQSLHMQIETARAREIRLRQQCQQQQKQLEDTRTQEVDRATALGLSDVADLEIQALAERLTEVCALADAAKTLQVQQSQLAEQQQQLAQFDEEVRTLAQRLHQPDAPPLQQIEALSGALQQAQSRAAARRQVELECDEREQAMAETEAASAQIAKHLAHWQNQVDAGDLQELGQMAKTSKMYVHLKDELDAREQRLTRGLGDARTTVETLVRTHEQPALEAACVRFGRELATLEARRFSEVERRGKLQAAFETLGGDRAAKINSQVQQELAELEDNVRQFAITSLARRVLSDVTEAFVREHQPQLFDHASKIMARITDGRHTRVEAEAQRDALVLIDARGNPRQPQELSTGTREQLFLALRLAYVLEYCARSEPLPMVMDDVLVNFDNARAGSTLAALHELSGSTQVLFLTCHAHLVEVAHRQCPSATFVELPRR